MAEALVERSRRNRARCRASPTSSTSTPRSSGILGPRPAQGHHRRAALFRRPQHRRDRRLPANGADHRVAPLAAGQSLALQRAVRSAGAPGKGRGYAGRPPAGAGTTAASLPRAAGAFRRLAGAEVLGEGASGRVLLTRRADLDDGRRVAIKTLDSPSRAALAHYELERQAQARLEHPNIARLYDAGKSAARVPTWCFENVAGLPIDDYCEQRPPGRGAAARFSSRSAAASSAPTAT